MHLRRPVPPGAATGSLLGTLADRLWNAAQAQAIADAVEDSGPARREYTTQAGRTIMATDAQIANWTRGSRA